VAGVALAARALGLGHQDADDRKQAHQDHEHLEGQVAGQTDRRQLVIAQAADHDLGGDEHGEFGEVGGDQGQRDPQQDDAFAKPRGHGGARIK
jgi:hypothetical protein